MGHRWNKSGRGRWQETGRDRMEGVSAIRHKRKSNKWNEHPKLHIILKQKTEMTTILRMHKIQTDFQLNCPYQLITRGYLPALGWPQMFEKVWNITTLYNAEMISVFTILMRRRLSDKNTGDNCLSQFAVFLNSCMCQEFPTVLSTKYKIHTPPDCKSPWLCYLASLILAWEQLLGWNFAMRGPLSGCCSP